MAIYSSGNVHGGYKFVLTTTVPPNPLSVYEGPFRGGVKRGKEGRGEEKEENGRKRREKTCTSPKTNFRLYTAFGHRRLHFTPSYQRQR